VTMPDCCPFCRSHDLRPLTVEGGDLTGFRCHDCDKTFYVTAEAQPVVNVAKQKQQHKVK